MIAIYEDTRGDLNPDEFAPTALYDDGEWLAGGEEWEPYYPEGTPEEAIAAQLDGPSPVAVEVTEGSDELLAEIEKTVGDGVEEGETSSITDRNNDGHDESEETGPPWATSKAQRAAKDVVGPTQATLLGVGDEVTVVDEEDDDNPDRDAAFSDREKVDKDLGTSNSNRGFDFVEGSDSGRVHIDRVSEAPDDAIVHATTDDEGDVQDLWYEL